MARELDLFRRRRMLFCNWKSTPLIFRFVGNNGLHGQLAMRMWVTIHEGTK